MEFKIDKTDGNARACTIKTAHSEILTPVFMPVGTNATVKAVSKDDLEEILNIASHNPDYFGTFNTVPAICEVLHYYEAARSHGMSFFFEGDY